MCIDNIGVAESGDLRSTNRRGRRLVLGFVLRFYALVKISFVKEEIGEGRRVLGLRYVDRLRVRRICGVVVGVLYVRR